jgi:hypothetical protein
VGNDGEIADFRDVHGQFGAYLWRLLTGAYADSLETRGKHQEPKEAHSYQRKSS